MSTADLLDEPQTEDVPVHLSESLYEEIDGFRVEKPPMSSYAATVINRLNRHLGTYTEANGLGEMFAEMLFVLPLRDRTRNRRPDVAFVPFDRWPKDHPVEPSQNAWDVVPALIAEVVSPTDYIQEQQTKIEEYFEAGVLEVWIIHPVARFVEVRTAKGQIHHVKDSEPLDGGSIVPGWSLKLADILPPVALKTK